MIRWLYLKALWLRKTYSFNWAHKPLCQLYRQDVIRIGHIHLCRSCVCAYLGFFAGFLLPILAPVSFQSFGREIVIALMLVILPLSYPTIYKKIPRRMRDVLRFTLGGLLASCGWLLLTGNLLLAVTSFMLCYLFWKIYYRKRAKRKIEACSSCEEYEEERICSGYKIQAQFIREYEEQATEYVLRTGYFPDHFK